MAVDIGIDLGTASILVYVKGKGVILKEPSVVAFDRDSNEVKAIGEEARLMLGRTPGNIIAVCFFTREDSFRRRTVLCIYKRFGSAVGQE